jgi:glycosyltransferase involved in cell wall biosynthesis
MKIGVVAPAAVPYTRGGFERLWSGFVNHVNDQTNHQAELIKVPFPETTLHGVIEGYRRFANIDVSGFDMVITSKYPGWMIDHPNHHVYMAHVLRGLYETYPASFPTSITEPTAHDLSIWLDAIGPRRSEIGSVFAVYDEAVKRYGHDHPIFGHPGPFGRRLVQALDRIGLSPNHVRRHAAIAQTVADRPGYFPTGAHVEVIHPPTDLPLILGNGPGSYLFTASRLDGPKRIDLLIEAFRQTTTDVEFKIAGTGPEADRLRILAEGDSRITFLGFVPDGDLPGLYAGAIAVPFVPADEDYGLIALEALQSGTPVITATDSGGPTELVQHLRTGWVVAPTPDALADAMAQACANPSRSRDWGHRGAASVKNVTWEHVAKQLVRVAGLGSEPISASHQARRPTRRRILALNTFTAHSPQGGGALRAFHIGMGLAKRFDVHLLSLTEPHLDGWSVTTAPGFSETAIPRTEAHMEYEFRDGGAIGIPVGDLYGGKAIAFTPQYLRQLRLLARDADAIMLSHPYMEPALDLARIDLPVIYDAYNVEARLKDMMFPMSEAGIRGVAEVRAVEAATVARAELLATCSAEDARMFAAVYGPLPPTVMIANGTHIDAIPFVVGKQRIRRRTHWLRAMGADPDARIAVFLASWHQPNLDAAEELHSIAADMPGVLFVMVGSHCEYFRGRQLPTNVIQMGRIGDATKRILLEAADVGLNPMETGSGTNLKMVEYLASGMATVTTPTGARGLPTEEPLVYNAAEIGDFAEAIRWVLAIDHDDPIRLEKTARARRLVEAEFGWSQLTKRFADAIDHTVFDRDR